MYTHTHPTWTHTSTPANYMEEVGSTAQSVARNVVEDLSAVLAAMESGRSIVKAIVGGEADAGVLEI